MSFSASVAVLRGIDWRFLIVRTINLLSYCWNVFKMQSVKSSMFLLDSLSPNIYVFFEGSSIPVAVRDYKQTAAGTPAVAAYYNRDTQSLHTDTTSENFHSLLFESVSLSHRDICLYDLTDFFNDTKFYGATPASLDTWVAAWCLNTGIYLDRKKSFTVRGKQFLENDSRTFTLWSTDEDEKADWSRICRPPGVFHHQAIRRRIIDVSGNTVCMPEPTTTVDANAGATTSPKEEESSKLE